MTENLLYLAHDPWFWLFCVAGLGLYYALKFAFYQPDTPFPWPDGRNGGGSLE